METILEPLTFDVHGQNRRVDIDPQHILCLLYGDASVSTALYVPHRELQFRTPDPDEAVERAEFVRDFRARKWQENSQTTLYFTDERWPLVVDANGDDILETIAKILPLVDFGTFIREPVSVNILHIENTFIDKDISPVMREECGAIRFKNGVILRTSSSLEQLDHDIAVTRACHEEAVSGGPHRPSTTSSGEGWIKTALNKLLAKCSR